VSLPRLSLTIAGILFVGFGGYLFYAPEALASLTKAPRLTALMVNEVRAMYGGLELGLGGFFLVAASRSRWVLPALAAQVAVFTGLAFGRLGGMVMDNAYPGVFVAFAVIELLLALLGVIGMRRARQRMELSYSHRP
jgi:hypothetical protein